MMLPLKTGLIATAASAFLFAAPVVPAAAAPVGAAPGALVRAELPIDHVRYRRHAVRRGHYVMRHRHYAPRRHYVRRYYRRYRYGFNPGVAVLGTVLGAVAAANAYNYYDPGYYPYAYPAYSYPVYGYGYPGYYGWGWGGRRFYGGHVGWGGGHAIRAGHWGWRR